MAKIPQPISTEAAPGPVSMILATDLTRRSSRLPDYAAENQAPVAAQEMATWPSDILQKLAETALTLCRAHSAGFSLLEDRDQKRNFRWHAVVGKWAPHAGRGTPRDFGPCGTIWIETRPCCVHIPNAISRTSARCRPCWTEGPLIPLYVDGEAVGTIWVISHDESRRFDAEDLRVMTNLGNFAGAAYKTLLSPGTTIKAHQDRLNELSKRLMATSDLLSILHEILDGIIELQSADFGDVQLYDEATGTLNIVAHRGLDRTFPNYCSTFKVRRPFSIRHLFGLL